MTIPNPSPATADLHATVKSRMRRAAPGAVFALVTLILSKTAPDPAAALVLLIPALLGALAALSHATVAAYAACVLYSYEGQHRR